MQTNNMSRGIEKEKEVKNGKCFNGSSLVSRNV